jgi:hypothetical protein
MESKMTVAIKKTVDENPYQSPATNDLSPAGKRNWLHVNIPPHVLGILLLLGILQYWIFAFVFAVWGIVDFSITVLYALYIMHLVHWSSVGGLVGFAISKKKWRGSLIGIIVGLILTAMLTL